MVMVGAAAGDLRQLAQRFRTTADGLDGARRALEARLRCTNWPGRDGDQFRQEWYGQHRPALNGVAQSVRQLAEVLIRQAEEQDRASEAGASSAGSRNNRWAGLPTGGVGGIGAAVLAGIGVAGGIALKLPSIHEVVADVGKNRKHAAALAHELTRLGQRSADTVSDLLTKHFPSVTPGLIKSSFLKVAAGGDAFSAASDTYVAVRDISENGWTTDSAFKAFDAVGSGLQLAKGPVPYLGGLIIKTFTDVGRQAVEADWTTPLPPLTADSLREIYLPSLGDGVTKTFLMTADNL